MEIEVQYDETSTSWNPSGSYNHMFLLAQQNYFNQRLQSFGFVILNEVYEALGIPRTTQGCITGWVLLHDDHIDFGLDQVENWCAATLRLNVKGIMFGYIDMINRAVTS